MICLSLFHPEKDDLSYNNQIEKLPKYLIKYFSANSYIILYPDQIKNISNANLKPLEGNIELLDKAENYVKKIFNRAEDLNEKKK